jgi:hypothetical protein
LIPPLVGLAQRIISERVDLFSRREVNSRTPSSESLHHGTTGSITFDHSIVNQGSEADFAEAIHHDL